MQYYTAALKFVPRFLLDLLGKDDIRNIDFGSTVSLIGTIVCIDIKGFTVWSENRLPQEIISKTNEAWTSLIPHIHSCNGAVVSFTGDGLIILFPKNPLDALTFIVCTMERKKNDAAFIPDFDFGMGVHYGSIILGTVGQSSQMHITVLSDIVNTAARIEGVTRDTKSMCAASGAFIRACGIGKSSTLQIKPTGHRTNSDSDSDSDSIFLGVGMCYLGARMFKGKSIAIELFDIAFAQNAAEFKQIVDFINRSENLKRGIEYSNESDCLLTAAEKENPILVHYLKHAAKTEFKLAEAQSAEAA